MFFVCLLIKEEEWLYFLSSCGSGSARAGVILPDPGSVTFLIGKDPDTDPTYYNLRTVKIKSGTVLNFF
jgi:hypothetical protein